MAEETAPLWVKCTMSTSCSICHCPFCYEHYNGSDKYPVLYRCARQHLEASSSCLACARKWKIEKPHCPYCRVKHEFKFNRIHFIEMMAHKGEREGLVSSEIKLRKWHCSRCGQQAKDLRASVCCNCSPEVLDASLVKPQEVEGCLEKYVFCEGCLHEHVDHHLTHDKVGEHLTSEVFDDVVPLHSLYAENEATVALYGRADQTLGWRSLLLWKRLAEAQPNRCFASSQLVLFRRLFVELIKKTSLDEKLEAPNGMSPVKLRHERSQKFSCLVKEAAIVVMGNLLYSPGEVVKDAIRTGLCLKRIMNEHRLQSLEF